MKRVHILRTRPGPIAELTVDLGTGATSTFWRPAPPWSDSTAARVKAEFIPWRARILREWADHQQVSL